MKEILLNHGYVALVDDDDYDAISHMPWRVWAGDRRTNYAMCNVKRENGTWTTKRMHRVILDVPDGVIVDHVDGNGLNNQRSNLRLVTVAENARNTPVRLDNTSGYKGVSWYKRYSKWVAKINLAGATKHVGYYDDLVVAARAYDEAAKELHGEYARLNFPEGD